MHDTSILVVTVFLSLVLSGARILMPVHAH